MDQKAKKVRTIDTTDLRLGRSEDLMALRKSESEKDLTLFEWFMSYFSTNL